MSDFSWKHVVSSLPEPESRPFIISEKLTVAMPHLRHGFTFGLPRLGDPEIAQEVRVALGGFQFAPWVFNQPHGPDILHVAGKSGADREGLSPEEVPVTGYDGGRGQLNGRSAGPAFAIKAADCVTILAALPGVGAYAALHAGWRGVAAGILPRLLSEWRGEGGDLSEAVLVFGPHIRSCCFEVKEDCLSQFPMADLSGAVTANGGRTYLNLERVLRNQAAQFQIEGSQIEALDMCTCCHAVDGRHPFASYRRAQKEGRPAGRNLAFIGPAHR